MKQSEMLKALNTLCDGLPPEMQRQIWNKVQTEMAMLNAAQDEVNGFTKRSILERLMNPDEMCRRAN